MEKDPKYWDDIPFLDDLDMDWSYPPVSANGNRGGKRMSKKELITLFGTANIPVQTVIGKAHKVGSLHDISVGGLSIMLDSELTENQVVKVGLFLGRKEIISRAEVRHIDRKSRPYRVGMQFVQLSKENSEYLAENGAKALNQIRAEQ